jgi:hypothetical protein
MQTLLSSHSLSLSSQDRATATFIPLDRESEIKFHTRYILIRSTFFALEDIIRDVSSRNSGTKFEFDE